MTEGTEPEPQVLEGEAALALWRKGQVEWNNWVNQHRSWKVSFYGVDFSSEQEPEGELSFSGYDFGDGNVNFNETTFGDCDVNFSEANFGDGNVDFYNANFGDCDVNFSDATFGDGDVNFSDATFGDGKVNFNNATFGDGKVNFDETTFGDCDVNFSDATFGDGDVNFSYANFGGCDVNFSSANFRDCNVNFSSANFRDCVANFYKATFGDGDVNFRAANFGDGIVYFIEATFGDGDVNFSYANFGDGNVYFTDTNFGDGNVNFIEATFGDGDVNFSDANFGDGNVNFSVANFGDGEVCFSGANFGDGNLNFDLVTFGDGSVIFTEAKLAALYFNPSTIGTCRIEAEDLSIKNRAVFEFPPDAEAITFLSLQGGSFDGPLRLSGNIGIIPDLRATRYSHQVDLSALNIKLRRAWQWRSWPPKLSPVAQDPTDGAKSRRLKEIAETNKDHHAALRFSADENRARRWRETSWLGSVLDMAFSACSDYGQNILRPTAALLVFTVAFTLLYKSMTTAASTNIGRMWDQAILLSISNSMPFLPQSRILRTDAIDVLYCGTPSMAVYAIMIAQGLFSFAFLFLIGLGLRNRFRL